MAFEKPNLESEKSIPLKDAFVSNFGEADSTDLRLKCGSGTFNVHKDVLCNWSDFFKKVCLGGFKEASSGVIDLSEDDSDAVKAMLQFFYTIDYAYDTALHAKVYAIAENYDIKPLKDLARVKFEKAADRDWDSPYFPTTISFVYTSTPPSDRGLRDIVIKRSKDHLNALLDSPEFGCMIEGNGVFGRDLVKAIAHRPEPEPGAATYKCAACGKSMTAWLNPSQNVHCPSCGVNYSYTSWTKWKQ
ncbi:BTB/POZ protein [Phaeosphaeriaceae sp. PMI808]|nr:BTB/POZ protein [Phaeosphaeriaceae sp. PMI808]